MTPTKPSTLAALVLAFAALGYLLAETSYGSLPSLSLLAPVSVVALAVAEGGMAKVVRDRLTGRARPGSRPLHPMQVARAAALAKASSAGGAVLLGLYAGMLAWTGPRRAEVASTGREALAAGLSALACLALVLCALLLERSCRTPPDPP